MQPRNSGSLLAKARKEQERSLQYVSDRMGEKGLSKQALFLIESGRMRIPAARRAELKVAYELSTLEQIELDRLFAFEQLVEDTGEDREFGEAILSVVDATNAKCIYVIGGRVLSITSPILQAKAAEFLQRSDSLLIFIYPQSRGFVPSNSLWFPNTKREMVQIQQSIQTFSTRSVANQIQFYGIDVRSAGNDPLLSEALSLCVPFAAITITSPRSPHQVAGYVYIEGPRDRWVLLKFDHAARILSTVNLLLARAVESKGVIRSSPNP